MAERWDSHSDFILVSICQNTKDNYDFFPQPQPKMRYDGTIIEVPSVVQCSTRFTLLIIWKYIYKVWKYNTSIL